MKLVDFLCADAITVELKAQGKRDALEELCGLLSKAKKLSEPGKMVKTLMDREALGSTGIGQGVAIPHGKTEGVKNHLAALGISRRGVEFDALDGEPVHILFLLIAPSDGAGSHLKALAKISRLLKDKFFRQALRDAKSATEILNIIQEEDEYVGIRVMAETPAGNPSPLTIEELWKNKAESLRLSLLAGQPGFKRVVRVVDINRPGLTLAGFFDYYRGERLQVFGMGESAFLSTLSSAQRMEIFDRILSVPELPCLILTHGREPVPEMLEQCERYQIPLFQSQWETARLIGEMTAYLEERLAPSTSMHGTLASVYGMGVLILGSSGIGKSECALELLKRGHMLVADDRVEIHQKPGNILVGTGSALVQHHMEVRGLGIIDVWKIFGVGAALNRSLIELAVYLEMWDPKKEYDRMGLEEKTTAVLGVPIPEIRVPVHPGRNLAALIEVAALNQRLKQQGVYSARELNERLIQKMSGPTSGR